MKWINSTWMHISDTWSYRSEPERLRILIEAYWRVLLGAAGVVMICAVLYSSANLISALGREEGEPTLSPSGGRTTFNRAGLQAALSGFAERETNYEFLKKNPPNFADPSK
ncbi:hypothetical protein A3B35_01165 [Candidatus Kaiserbacteria bacterium RIFCSPLOWO2_01_FULL_54_24]|uniref:Uncharacterized protein n=1 Tax=Candidatus Kaiserbacteria bacterium RIFCSPLOWO2_01_FULL_54_24 TaxID=1798515 RepID=A0A1F6EVV3_9BACT|nr:MAG: hypothetical protein A3B35_01165 [Candidatus Kaiserbacteria bacterium RIFCSPLOWO2_01_FULL_54_24]